MPNVKKFIIDGVQYDIPQGGVQPIPTPPMSSIGTYVESSSTYNADNSFLSSGFWAGDGSWFQCVEPKVSYSLGGTNIFDCNLVAHKTEIDVGGIWIATNTLSGGIAASISDGLDVRSTAYFAVPGHPDKQIEVTLYITGGTTVTTNTAQLV